MDVILLEDLKGVGAKGALVHVKPGYARNYLLPRQLAIPAGTNAVQRFQELERQRQRKEDKLLVDARAEAARLDGLQIDLTAPANEEGTLFGSITNADVADALAKAGHAMDKRKVELEDHIKQTGIYDVVLRFYGGVTATIKVWVTAQ